MIFRPENALSLREFEIRCVRVAANAVDSKTLFVYPYYHSLSFVLINFGSVISGYLRAKRILLPSVFRNPQSDYRHSIQVL